MIWPQGILPVSKAPTRRSNSRNPMASGMVAATKPVLSGSVRTSWILLTFLERARAFSAAPVRLTTPLYFSNNLKNAFNQSLTRAGSSRKRRRCPVGDVSRTKMSNIPSFLRSMILSNDMISSKPGGANSSISVITSRSNLTSVPRARNLSNTSSISLLNTSLKSPQRRSASISKVNRLLSIADCGLRTAEFFSSHLLPAPCPLPTAHCTSVISSPMG